MNLHDIQRRLTDNHFDTKGINGVLNVPTLVAVKTFQRAYAGPNKLLDIDGDPGPLTQAALLQLPNLSPHFVVAETWCKHCQQVGVYRGLLLGLEALRAARGRPIALASCYRCPVHNKDVGGAPDSMHVFGAAGDLDLRSTVISVTAARAVRQFSGIGNRGSLASHVDVRHLMGSDNRTPNATVLSPERWDYPS